MKPPTQIPAEVTRAITEWVERERREAFAAGEAAAYPKAWDEAMSAFIEAAASKRPLAAQQPETKRPGGIRPRFSVPTNASSPPLNSRDFVIRALNAKPGMRAAEVARWARDHHDANENTVKTQIKRMKKNKEFEQRSDNKLFLKGATKEAA